jgi:hypothetical protein
MTGANGVGLYDPALYRMGAMGMGMYGMGMYGGQSAAMYAYWPSVTTLLGMTTA